MLIILKMPVLFITTLIFRLISIQLNQELNGNGSIDIQGSIDSGSNIAAQGEVTSNGGTHVLSVKKNFDIPSPNQRRLETSPHLY